MEEIYKEYSKFIFNYLLSFTGNVEIAEELMQETFLSAILNIEKFTNKSSLKTWLCKIAKNKWIDYYKKNKKIKEINIDEINENLFLNYCFEDDCSKRNDQIDLYNNISKLDKNTQEVIFLRVRGNLTFKEIGRIMEKTEEWARITFYRGKIKLKEEMDNE